MLESPRMVRTPGSSALIRRIASMVSMPSRRDSTIPVESGRAKRVDEDVLGVEAVARDGEVGDGARGADLPLGRARLSLFVDAGRDDGGAELGGE